MEEQQTPSYANGKICYIIIPATDINESVSFYKVVFDWNIRQNDDDSYSFDDTTGQVSGMWLTGLKPMTETGGLMIHIMVFDMQLTCEAIVENGGNIVEAADMDATEKVALFSDPAGNVFGLYEQPMQ